MKRSLVFWMWNAPLDKALIRQQIREMHEKHIGGFFIHPMPSEFRAADFPGGMPGYLSDEYFQMVRYAAECAAECGMDAWLYDEGGWPSGTVNGELMAQHPEYRGVNIAKIEERQNPLIAEKFDYFYVPCFFIEGVKVHEGVPTLEKVENALKIAAEV